jgi:hypothetical protein
VGEDNSARVSLLIEYGNAVALARPNPANRHRRQNLQHRPEESWRHPGLSTGARRAGFAIAEVRPPADIRPIVPGLVWEEADPRASAEHVERGVDPGLPGAVPFDDEHSLLDPVAACGR